MKKTLAWLLCLLLLCSCLGASAETAGFQYRAALNVPRETMLNVVRLLGTEPNENTARLFGSLADALSTVTLNIQTDGENLLASVLMGEKPLAELKVRADENGLRAESDCFPTYTLIADAETLAALEEKLGEPLPVSIAELPLLDIAQETGDYTVDGMHFVTKESLELRLKDVTEALENQMGAQPQNGIARKLIEKAAEKLWSLAQTAETLLPGDAALPDPETLAEVPLTLNYYLSEAKEDEDGFSYDVAAELVSAADPEALNIVLTVPTSGEKMHLLAKAGDDLSVDAAFDMTADGPALRADLTVRSHTLRIESAMTGENGNLQKWLNVYTNGAKPALSVTEELTPGCPALTVELAAEGKTELKIAEFSDASAALQAVKQDMRSRGLSRVLTNLAGAAPLEVSMLLMMLLPTPTTAPAQQ